ncbi:hypothetical protein LSH36_355g00024 [Paralvinella palmiformis]|uniref:Uncharacterized protein n=1 Tax=Paralvinella palmiformis TaxID=53620 RepID=A0AAD9JEX3_9ANNE|nr:hypothetical protein LSH36_355g00024 [Paralvinella palmiformis]
MTSESEAPDIDGVEATDEGFEDAPQEGTRERTSGSLMESDLLGMTGAREPIGQNTYTRRCFAEKWIDVSKAQIMILDERKSTGQTPDTTVWDTTWNPPRKFHQTELPGGKKYH